MSVAQVYYWSDFPWVYNEIDSTMFNKKKITIYFQVLNLL